MFVHKCNFLQLSFKINAIFQVFSATKICSTDMNESKHSDELLIFYTKQAIALAETVVQSFVDQKPQIQISLSFVKLSSHQNDALKNFYI